MASTICQTLAECSNPYPEIATSVETKGCADWSYLQIYRQGMIAVIILVAHYVQQLIFAGMYIREAKMKR